MKRAAEKHVLDKGQNNQGHDIMNANDKTAKQVILGPIVIHFSIWGDI